MRTRNLDEAIEAVSRVYCPHSVAVARPARDIDAFLDVRSIGAQPLVTLSYSAAVEIDAQDFSRLFLMMHCDRGAAAATQAGHAADWGRGQTMPLSAGFDTRLRFDRDFVQAGLRLDHDRLEALCARWLGRPLDAPLRFALQPFSDALERTWRHTMNYLAAIERDGLALPAPVRTAADDLLMTLVLQHHPHNYSAELAAPAPGPAPGFVLRAERYIAAHAASPIAAADVAHALGVSVRTLQAGFRNWRNTTPSAALRKARLDLARDALRRPDGDTTVAAVAFKCGFAHLGRFSVRYRAAFGEPPAATLRRARRPLQGSA
ncbi:MAG: AraC family transcriptional regulator [Rhodospirillales bacterium]